MANTLFSYGYRDAAGEVVAAELVLGGEVTDADRETIRAALHEGRYFIASQVGLPSLQRRPRSHLGANDHVWHEIHPEGQMRPTGQRRTCGVSLATVVGRFSSARWDPASDAFRLGLDEVYCREVGWTGGHGNEAGPA